MKMVKIVIINKSIFHRKTINQPHDHVSKKRFPHNNRYNFDERFAFIYLHKIFFHMITLQKKFQKFLKNNFHNFFFKTLKYVRTQISLSLTSNATFYTLFGNCHIYRHYQITPLTLLKNI